MHLKLFNVKYQVCKYLSEEHECVVGSEVLGEELNTVTLQSRDGVLLRRVQSRHHSLGTDVDLVRIQEPGERKTEQCENSGSHVVICRMNQKGLATIFDTETSLKKGIYSAECLFIFFWDSLSKIAFESWDQTSRQIYCLVLFFPYHTTPELYHKSADFSLYFFGIYFAISANVISLSKEFI